MSDGITIMMGTPEENGLTAGSSIPKYGVGKKCRGKVVNFKPYGFFVETEDGGFGLVHGRNIAGWDWSRRFDRVFRHGSEIEVTVVDVEAETNRLSFSCEMPVEAVEPEPEPEPMPAFKEIADEWAEKEPEKSAAAFAWLKAELDDGPLYGPLTNILCDRFGVPVPVSRWIRTFPEFVCYSGKGDNPSDLPAVALASHAGDVAYWKRIKTRTEELAEMRDRGEDPTVKLAAKAERLQTLKSFPGSRWIADYQESAKRLLQGKGVYGASDVAEKLALPLLGALGWDVSKDNAALVRGGADAGFNAVIYGGPFGSGKVSVALLCAAPGTDFDSLRDRTESPTALADRNAVERLLGLYNQIGGADEPASKVVWTDGVTWIVLTPELLAQRIGILADHRGNALMDETARGEGNSYRRVDLPSDAAPLDWLVTFAELQSILGK